MKNLTLHKQATNTYSLGQTQHHQFLTNVIREQIFKKNWINKRKTHTIIGSICNWLYHEVFAEESEFYTEIGDSSIEKGKKN